MDVFEKNFHMFYDTYGTVVGHLNKSTCKKYSKFNTLGCNMCEYLDVVKTSKLMETDTQAAIYQIYTTEYEIEFDMVKNNEYMSCGGQKGHACCACSGCCTGGDLRKRFSNNSMDNKNPWLHYGWLSSSIDHNLFVRFAGWNFKKELSVLGHYQYNVFTASNKYYNSTLPHELDNEAFRSALDMHNTVYFDVGRGITQTSSSEDAETGETTTQTTRNNASFSAKLVAELDAKIDDGRPGKGKLLALKGGAAHNANTSEDQHKKVCYDQMADQVDKAIYETSTDIKYGCNIIKVMEDVK